MAIEKKSARAGRAIDLGDTTPTAALADATRRPVEMVQISARVPKRVDFLMRAAMALEGERFNWKFIDKAVTQYVEQHHPSLLNDERARD